MKTRLVFWLVVLCAYAVPSVLAGAPGARDSSTLRAVLDEIGKNYVEPTRIDPEKMLWAAARALDRDVPEVSLESHPGQETLTLQVSGERKTFPAAAVRSLSALAQSVQEVLRFVGDHRTPSSKPNAEYVAINGMLATLDPHSVLLDPAEAREFSTNLANRISGIGIVMDSSGSNASGAKPGETIVMTVLKGGPAEEAGITACDRILAVEDRWAAGLGWEELAGLIRGPTGSPVWITLQRDGAGVKDFVVTRAQIRFPSVISRRLDGNVGLIRINWFVRGTAAEVRSALADMKKAGVTSWILDLRTNAGGLTREAIETASAFVRTGPIVTVVGQGGREREVEEARRSLPGPVEEGPLVLLTGPSTVSAAELCTGALQNRNRAVVLGRTSYGKGSVQKVFDNVDGSKLKLTVALYFTPGGDSLQARGVTPDIELVPVPAPGPGRIRLSAVPVQSEADLDRAFAAREGLRRSDFSLRYLAATPDGEEEVRIAHDLLVDTRAESRAAALVRGAAFLKERRDAEEAKLVAILMEAGVDWSTGLSKAPPRLSVRCEQHGPPVGDRVPVDCEIRNDGAGDAFHVLGRARASAFDLKNEEIVVGRVPAGASRKVMIDGGLAEDPSPRVSYVGFAFSEQGGATVEGAPLRIEIPPRARPPGSGATPRLQILIEPGAQETAQDVQHLRATVRGAEIRDAWVRISNQSAGLDRKKVTFLSRPPGGPADRLEIESDVPLQTGLNEIGVCARGKEEERCETAFVFRLPAGVGH